MDSRYKNNIYTHVCSSVTENKCYPEDLHHGVEGKHSSYQSKQCTPIFRQYLKAAMDRNDKTK